MLTSKYPIRPLTLVVPMNEGAATRFMHDNLGLLAPLRYQRTSSNQTITIVQSWEALDEQLLLVDDRRDVVVYFVLNKVCGLHIWKMFKDSQGDLRGPPYPYSWSSIEEVETP